MGVTETLCAPVNRGRRKGVCRFCRPRDRRLLAGIKRLIEDEGYSVSGVKKILKDKGVGHVAMLSGTDAPSPSSDEVTIPRETLADLVREVETLKNALKALRQQANL